MRRAGGADSNWRIICDLLIFINDKLCANGGWKMVPVSVVGGGSDGKAAYNNFQNYKLHGFLRLFLHLDQRCCGDGFVWTSLSSAKCEDEASSQFIRS